MFATMIDPSMLSSLNYLSALTPAESHDYVILYEQSVALISSANNVENNHVNEKAKPSNLNENITNVCKRY